MKAKVKKRVVLIAFVVICLLIYVSICVSKSLMCIGKSFFESQMSAASYVAVEKALDVSAFDDLYSVIKDNDGNVVMLCTNGIKTNALAKTLAEQCLRSFDVLADGGVCVPIGAFTGITFLSGVGKKVKLKLIAIQSVKCEFISKFEQSGINQTKQSLYLKIIPTCKVFAGFNTQNIDYEIDVLCYENYIIGKIPQTYLDVSSFVAKKS